MDKNDKPVIAFYTQRFLNPSTTFIYRQLKGVEAEFNPVVLTPNKSAHLDVFPFEPVFELEKTLAGRCYRLIKKASGRFAVLSGNQITYFRKVLDKNNVKLIHAHFGPSAIEILPVAKALNIPLLVTFHGYDASSLLGNKRYINDLKPVFEYSHVIAVSNYMAETLISFGAVKERTSVIYYGIPIEDNFVRRDPLKPKSEKGEKLVFLQISNFDEKKGHSYTISAFKKFLEFYPNAILRLGGDGPVKPSIEELARQEGISNKVEFLGRIKPKDVFPEMARADIFVHHSVTSETGNKEGIPNVIIEAMSTGMFAISTYHSGIPELISDGENGYLVNEKDVDSYAEAMRRAICSEESLRLNARNRVIESFNLEEQSQKLRNRYKGIIGANF